MSGDGRSISCVRRFVSGLCLTLTFVAVSLAQSAWWLSHTVFDTAAFGDAVHAVAAQPDVRAAMGEDVSGVLVGARDLSAKQSAALRGAVDSSVSTPAFADELAATLTRAHAALLAGRNPATALDLGPVQADVRRSLASTDPHLAAAVPSGSVQRNVDPGRLPWVPRVVDAVGASVALLVGAALVLLAVAVLVARDRPRTLRRAGYVLVASAAFTLVIRFVVPAVLVPLLPAGVVRTLGAAVTAFLLAALLPALLLTAGAGALLVVIGIAWARSRSRAGAVAPPAPSPRFAAAGTAPPPGPPPGPGSAPLPAMGPPIANVDVVTPAASIPPVTAPAVPLPDATARLPAAGGEAAETVEDPGGWGPLRY